MNQAGTGLGLHINEMFLSNCNFQLWRCRWLSATNMSANRFFCFLFVLCLCNIGTSHVQQKNKSTWNIPAQSQPKASPKPAQGWPKTVWTAWTSCRSGSSRSHWPVGMFQDDQVCVRPTCSFWASLSVVTRRNNRTLPNQLLLGQNRMLWNFPETDTGIHWKEIPPAFYHPTLSMTGIQPQTDYYRNIWICSFKYMYNTRVTCSRWKN